MIRHSRRWPAIAALAMLIPLALVACGGESRGLWAEPSEEKPEGPPPALEITPAQDADDAPISTEIGTDTDGEITEVVLTAKNGKPVDGEMRDDGSSWIPDNPLKPDTKYTAAVTASGADGQTTTAETTFTTMREPTQRTGTGLYVFDGQEYGVAMPVVVEFVQPVPEKARADVQRRMFVTTDPPQPGVWHWVESGTQAFYRAPDYWQPGTKLDVRIALNGQPMGDGWYGDTDRSATATIGNRVEMEVVNKTKSISVYEDGELLKTVPVSLGKPETPSSSGHMVVMTKEEQTVFDTRDELGPEEGYRIDITYAMRLTWGGEYVHAAPWSVGDQGERNVSHGCVNLSTENAKWLFDLAKVGDPVIVKGTEEQLEQGNGWTAWDLSWEEYIKGSALPVPPELDPAQVGDAPTSTLTE